MYAAGGIINKSNGLHLIDANVSMISCDSSPGFSSFSSFVCKVKEYKSEKKSVVLMIYKDMLYCILIEQ